MTVKNPRMTVVKELLLRIVSHNPGFTARQVFEHKCCPTDVMSTVQRALAEMEERGWITRTYLEDVTSRGGFSFLTRVEGERVLEEIDTLRIEIEKYEHP